MRIVFEILWIHVKDLIKIRFHQKFIKRHNFMCLTIITSNKYSSMLSISSVNSIIMMTYIKKCNMFLS